jgi:hypothetical protein
MKKSMEGMEINKIIMVEKKVERREIMKIIKWSNIIIKVKGKKKEMDKKKMWMGIEINIGRRMKVMVYIKII